jgi:predicted O-methyltransferase YrrM
MDRFIDAAVEQFAHDHTEPETDLYARLREETYRVMTGPQMQVGLLEGRFLKMLVRPTGARNILEIGMLTGYSALMMTEALSDDGRLITCEIDPKAEAIARKYFVSRARTERRSTSGWGRPWRRSRHFPVHWISFSSTRTSLTTATTTRPSLPFNDLVQTDPRVENVCLTVRDGMTLAWKRK